MTLHDAEKVVGRITVRKTWDRRYKIVHAKPEPTKATWSDIVAALAGFYVLGLLFVFLFVLWPVIGAYR